jgi:hypothetical protein
MRTLFNASRIATRGLLAATFMAGTGAVANAQSVASASARSEASVSLHGVVSVTELAASQANLEALRQPPVEKPRHRLPGGGLTSAPTRKTLDGASYFS